MEDEYSEILENIAVEIRELIFDDADDIVQSAMVASPIEVIGFACEWIKKAKYENEQLQIKNTELVEALKVARDSELFLSYLVEHCEGEILTEEFLTFKTSDMLNSQWYKDRSVKSEE